MRAGVSVYEDDDHSVRSGVFLTPPSAGISIFIKHLVQVRLKYSFSAIKRKRFVVRQQTALCADMRCVKAHKGQALHFPPLVSLTRDNEGALKYLLLMDARCQTNRCQSDVCSEVL